MSRECRVCGRAMLYSRLHECLMEPTRAEAPQGETQVIHGYTFPSFPAAQPETGGDEARVRETFWIPGPLPGMNEIIGAAKSGRGKSSAYSRQKATWTSAVALVARHERIGHFASPVAITCTWREPTSRRDPDNVCAGIKFVLDGLVAAGVLEGDGRRHIDRIEHRVETMPRGDNAGVWVSIEGVTP